MDGVNLIGCLSYGVGSHGLVDRDLHKYEHENTQQLYVITYGQRL